MQAALINPVLQKIASKTLNPEHVYRVSATEYINHPGGRLKAAQISRGNKQYVAPMLMGFSPLTCAAILIIN